MMRRRTFNAELAAAVLAAGSGVLSPRVHAQATPMRRLASLSPVPPGSALSFYVLEQLRQAGFEVGRNLNVEARFAEGDATRLPALAVELVRSKPEVIVAWGNEAVSAAQAATADIPIVMGFGAEPVEAGFVKSLAAPGGHITGTVWVSGEIAGKTLDVLLQAVPGAKRVAALGNPRFPGIERYNDSFARAAKARGLTVLPHKVERLADLDPALERIMADKPDALYVTPDAITETRAQTIAAFALRARLPMLGVSPQIVQAGGLLYYGPDIEEMAARTVSFIVRILRGARPSELPVEQPTHFRLIVNMKTAKALGLTIPQALLLRADEVIQ